MLVCCFVVMATYPFGICSPPFLLGKMENDVKSKILFAHALHCHYLIIYPLSFTHKLPDIVESHTWLDTSITAISDQTRLRRCIVLTIMQGVIVPSQGLAKGILATLVGKTLFSTGSKTAASP